MPKSEQLTTCCIGKTMGNKGRLRVGVWNGTTPVGETLALPREMTHAFAL